MGFATLMISLFVLFTCAFVTLSLTTYHVTTDSNPVMVYLGFYVFAMMGLLQAILIRLR